MIAELLRLYLRVNGIGLRKFAPELGLSAPTISRITRGESMDAATMLKVINWLFNEKASARGHKPRQVREGTKP